MATLELSLWQKGPVNWRGQLQTYLQRRLKRTPTRSEVWLDVHPCTDDESLFQATAHVVIRGQVSNKTIRQACRRAASECSCIWRQGDDEAGRRAVRVLGGTHRASA